MYSVGHNVNDTVPILWILRILSPPYMSHDTRSALEHVSRELQRRDFPFTLLLGCLSRCINLIATVSRV